MMSFALRGNSAAGSKESRERKQVVFLKRQKILLCLFSFFFILVNSWKKHEYSLSPREKEGSEFGLKLRRDLEK